MTLHLETNGYHGINAHLHSYLQQHNAWSLFHGEHITHLRAALQAQLTPATGYFVVSEKSLQIIRDDLISGTSTQSKSIADIGIYQTESSPTPDTSSKENPVLYEIPIIDTITEPENVSGIVIYKALPDSTGLGEPITRIELLSPANKPPGSHYRQYLAKRDETLYAGINLVEIDYLHERRSPIGIIPDYASHALNAHPYMVVISQPYPTLEEGTAKIHGFNVDEKIPTVHIPLDAGNHITLDLNDVYQQTYKTNLAFGLRFVDYHVLPENFESYAPQDQNAIKAVMARLSDAQKE